LNRIGSGFKPTSTVLGPTRHRPPPPLSKHHPRAAQLSATATSSYRPPDQFLPPAGPPTPPHLLLPFHSTWRTKPGPLPLFSLHPVQRGQRKLSPHPPSSPAREPPKTERHRILNIWGDVLSTPGRWSSPREAKGAAVCHFLLSVTTFTLLIDWVLPHPPHPSPSAARAYRRRRGSPELPHHIRTPLSCCTPTPHCR
jgi:hypothetical protein